MWIEEVAGTPGIRVDFYFTGVTGTPGVVLFYGYYNGNPAHEILAYIYNFTTLGWDRLTASATDIPSGVVPAEYKLPLPEDLTNYKSGNEIRIRFDHPDPGNINHDLIIDELVLIE